MKCCVPLCENTSENVFKSGRITLHWFPNDARLRAAWLRALGKQDCQQLPDCAVVCSQHFLHDDVCETESGSRQLRPGAVPSTVLVCMICLATDSEMSPISQYNLEAAYEKLTGHPLWDGGNLKQTLCVQCAERLRNFSRFREQSLRAHFSRFREQSLRARSLMMELLEKHELITMEHIKMIQHANNKQQNYLVSTTLGPDTCDMDVVGNTNEGKQTDSEEAVLGVGVKTECSDDSQCVDESIQAINEDTCDMDMVENTNKGKQTDSEEAVLGVGVKTECSDDSQCVDESIQAINEDTCDMDTVENTNEGKQTDSEEAVLGVGVKTECSDDSLCVDESIQAINEDTCDMDTVENTNEGKQTDSEEAVLGVGVKTECSDDSQCVDESIQAINEDTCDMDTVENTNEGKQTDSEEAVLGVGVKTECSDDSQCVDESIQAINEDTCDMHTVENTNEGKQTDSEEAVLGVGVKTECSDDSQCVDESIQAINEENSLADCVSEEFDEDLIKYESDIVFMCTVCSEEFPHEHAYSAHVLSHDDAHPAASSAQSVVAELSARLAINTSNERAPESDHRTNTDLKSCVVMLYDILKYPQNAEIKIKSSPQIMPGVSSRGSLNAHTACEDAQYRTVSEDEVAATHNEPAASVLSETEPGTSGHSSHSSRAHTFTCDVCQRAFTRRNHLIIHFRTHTVAELSARLAINTSNKRAPESDHRTNTDLKSCVVMLYDILKYPQNAEIKIKSSPQIMQAVSSRDILNAHTTCVAASHNKPAASVLSETEPGTSGHSSRTRTFTCDVCQRAFTRRNYLVLHLRTHTSEKSYSCERCSYKCTEKGKLVTHKMTHTDKKLYLCEICSYKCTKKCNFVCHMRTHTGEKPYLCEICSYKCAEKSKLVCHMRTHTGEKPYSCKICSYKCIKKSGLVRHMKIHSGEKPYSCKICSYKSIERSTLVCHMRTHTGEKPYSCKLCSYKCTHKGQLNSHMRTHKT